MGKLVVYYGTMNSGKSIDLIKTAHNYEENGFKVLIMKPIIDTKAGNRIETRIGLQKQVDILIDKKDSIIELLKGKLDGIKCVFVDEAQFLTSEQIEELYKISKCDKDLSIICYLIRLNFKGELFEGSKEFFARNDKLIELKTICHCGNIARFVGRKVNGNFVKDGQEVVIDKEYDNIEYVPLCAEHFYEEVLHEDLSLLRRRIYGK